MPTVAYLGGILQTSTLDSARPNSRPPPHTQESRLGDVHSFILPSLADYYTILTLGQLSGTQVQVGQGIYLCPGTVYLSVRALSCERNILALPFSPF